MDSLYGMVILKQSIDPLALNFDEDVIGEAVVVVYDITNPSSFDEAKDHLQKYWLQRARAQYLLGTKDLFQHLENCHVVGLVGSKADLWMHRKIKYEVLINLL